MNIDDNLLLRLENVGLKYRLRRPMNGSKIYWALSDISLELYKGETLGVIGSNGAGKSTLMRVLSGIVREDKGKVYRRPRVNYVLLQLGLGFESNLSGRENAILGGMLLGLHRATIEKRLEKIKAFSELGDFFEQPIYTYSSGMGARLAFSVAMETNPDVMLLDEIMSVGDTSFQEKSRVAILEKIKSDMTVVFISHDASMVQSLCKRATWIHKGVTQCSGSVDEVIDKYNKFMYQPHN